MMDLGSCFFNGLRGGRQKAEMLVLRRLEEVWAGLFAWDFMEVVKDWRLAWGARLGVVEMVREGSACYYTG